MRSGNNNTEILKFKYGDKNNYFSVVTINVKNYLLIKLAMSLGWYLTKKKPL